MSVARLEYDNAVQLADITTDLDGALRTDDGFTTAVIISLFTRRRANGQFGWWADALVDDGDPIGSKLWTLQRAKVNLETLRKVRTYSEEALAWMLTSGAAKSVAATAERLGMQSVALRIVILRADGSRWERLWKVMLDEL